MVTVYNSHYRAIEWSGKLVDAPATVKNYGTARLRPIEIRVNYRKRDDQWRAYKAEITGPLILSDGTDGKNHVSSGYFLDLGSLDDAPEWLLDIAAQHAPQVVS